MSDEGFASGERAERIQREYEASVDGQWDLYFRQLVRLATALTLVAGVACALMFGEKLEGWVGWLVSDLVGLPMRLPANFIGWFWSRVLAFLLGLLAAHVAAMIAFAAFAAWLKQLRPERFK